MNNENPVYPEANLPNEDTYASSAKSKLKDYGKKSLSPLLGLMQKYRGEFNPYFSAISKGIEGGMNVLSQENATPEERYVGEWFREASAWFGEVRTKLESKNIEDVIAYLEAESRENPGMTFSTSYLAGLFLGRIGRHMGRTSTTHSQPVQ